MEHVSFERGTDSEKALEGSYLLVDIESTAPTIFGFGGGGDLLHFAGYLEMVLLVRHLVWKS